MAIKPKFICLVQRERKKQKISQSQLSKKTGLNQRYISAVENNRVVPNIRTAYIFSDVLGKPINELWIRVR